MQSTSTWALGADAISSVGADTSIALNVATFPAMCCSGPSKNASRVSSTFTRASLAWWTISVGVINGETLVHTMANLDAATIATAYWGVLGR